MSFKFLGVAPLSFEDWRKDTTFTSVLYERYLEYLVDFKEGALLETIDYVTNGRRPTEKELKEIPALCCVFPKKDELIRLLRVSVGEEK
jgi:hypothetical protein